MLTANDTLHGWYPAGDDDDIEVNISHSLCFMAISRTTSSLSPTCPPLDTTLPKGRLGLPVPQSSSDRRAQRNRDRDPSWVPRPRNAFIIFRCGYSRKHAQGSGGSQDDHDTDSAKSLSKRAAEAWRNLPPSEKTRYKVLADMERQEHARIYPNYRFRPLKRQVSGTRRSPSVRSKSPKTTHAARTDPQTPLGVDFDDQMLFCPPSEATSQIDLFSSLYTSEGDTSLDTLRGFHSDNDDLERARALEAYAIGLYDHDFFSPFLFPQHC